jgi:hypothetical protein
MSIKTLRYFMFVVIIAVAIATVGQGIGKVSTFKLAMGVIAAGLNGASVLLYGAGVKRTAPWLGLANGIVLVLVNVLTGQPEMSIPPFLNILVQTNNLTKAS